MRWWGWPSTRAGFWGDSSTPDLQVGSAEIGHELSSRGPRLSNTMKLTALTLAVLALVAAPAAAEQKETERVDRTIAFAGGGTLKLRNFSGDVRVTGTAGNDIVVHAVRRATRERLDNIRLDIS